MDPFIVETVIPATIVFVVSILIGWLAKSGWDSIVMGNYSKAKNIFENFGPIIQTFDEELYNELKNVFNTLDASFADNSLTMAEFNNIMKSFKPLLKRMDDVIKLLGSKTN